MCFCCGTRHSNSCNAEHNAPNEPPLPCEEPGSCQYSGPVYARTTNSNRWWWRRRVCRGRRQYLLVAYLTAMRITAVIIAIFGILNLRALPAAFHQIDNRRWPLMLLASVLGVLLLTAAIGIWTKKIFTWYLGFIAIAWASASFVAQVFYSLPDVSNKQKVIIRVSCLVGAVLVAAYWSIVWYRQKKWFFKASA
jgi:hypothetical protein